MSEVARRGRKSRRCRNLYCVVCVRFLCGDDLGPWPTLVRPSENMSAMQESRTSKHVDMAGETDGVVGVNGLQTSGSERHQTCRACMLIICPPGYAAMRKTKCYTGSTQREIKLDGSTTAMAPPSSHPSSFIPDLSMGGPARVSTGKDRGRLLCYQHPSAHVLPASYIAIALRASLSPFFLLESKGENIR